MIENFNDHFRDRTKKLAVDIVKFCVKFRLLPEIHVIQNQLTRSASSVAANFRAACVSRSRAEYFAKLCIVIEEADESCFWFEMIDELKIIEKSEFESLHQEMLEILKVMSKTRKTLRST